MTHAAACFAHVRPMRVGWTRQYSPRVVGARTCKCRTGACQSYALLSDVSGTALWLSSIANTVPASIVGVAVAVPWSPNPLGAGAPTGRSWTIPILYAATTSDPNTTRYTAIAYRVRIRTIPTPSMANI